MPRGCFILDTLDAKCAPKSLVPITDCEVYEAVCTGEVLEIYPHDTPYPNALMLGVTEANRPLHIVCAYDSQDDRAVIITVYQPDPAQ